MSKLLGRNLRVVTYDQDDLIEDETVGSDRLGEFFVPLSANFPEAFASIAGNKKHELCSILMSPDVDVVVTICEKEMITSALVDLQQFRVTGGAGLHLKDYERFLVAGEPGYSLVAYVSPSTANFMMTAQIDLIEITALER